MYIFSNSCYLLFIFIECPLWCVGGGVRSCDYQPGESVREKGTVISSGANTQQGKYVLLKIFLKTL